MFPRPSFLFGSLRTPDAACVLPPSDKPQPMPVSIRWMLRRDMPAVLNIEELCFGDLAWSEDEFIRYLRQRNVIGMVADTVVTDGEYHGAVVVSYMIYELHEHRLHLANLAVHPTYQRRTVGEQMMANLGSKLHADRRHRILTEVRETNVSAQLFFKAQGFRAQQILRDFWRTGEDAYLMQKRYSEHPGESVNGSGWCKGR